MAIAIVASFAALWLFVRQRSSIEAAGAPHYCRCRRDHGLRYLRHALHRNGGIEVLSGFVLPHRSGVNGTWLAATVALLSVGALALTLILLFYDAHLQRSQAHAPAAAESQRSAPACRHTRRAHRPAESRPAERSPRAGHCPGGTQPPAVRRAHGRPRPVQVDQRLAGPRSRGPVCCREVAVRLRATLRKGDTLARIGGDEFIIILSGIAGAARRRGRRSPTCSAQVSQPFELAAIEIQTSPSVGVSLYPHDGDGSADAHQARRRRDVPREENGARNAFRFFSPEMNAFTRERLELERALRNAVAGRSSFFTTSRRWISRPARSSASRPSSAGTIRAGAWCRPRSSSRSPRKRASSCRSVPGC